MQSRKETAQLGGDQPARRQTRASVLASFLLAPGSMQKYLAGNRRTAGFTHDRPRRPGRCPWTHFCLTRAGQEAEATARGRVERPSRSASRPWDASEATQSWGRQPGGSSGRGPDFNDGVEDELGARTPSSPNTTRRQASLSTDRERSARHTHHKCRRSPLPASSARARCDPTHAQATRQHRCPSSGSPPQTCHRQSASRSSPHCHARDALPAPPNAGGHGPDALPAQREPRRGRDHRKPPPVPYPLGRCPRACRPTQLMNRAVLTENLGRRPPSNVAKPPSLPGSRRAPPSPVGSGDFSRRASR